MSFPKEMVNGVKDVIKYLKKKKVMVALILPVKRRHMYIKKKCFRVPRVSFIAVFFYFFPFQSDHSDMFMTNQSSKKEKP